MNPPQRIVVIGAGGQARDTAFLIRELAARGAPLRCVGYVLSDLSYLGPRDSRDEVLGDFGWLRDNRASIDGLAMGIGTPGVRLKLALELAAAFPELSWPVLVHPSVQLDHASATLERGTMIAAGTAGTVNVRLAEFALVNVGCTLGHEATIGRAAVINHGASISGGVVLEDGVLVGTGARVLQYLTVGQGATVGAGAVVTKDVAPHSVVVGVPARPLAARSREGA